MIFDKKASAVIYIQKSVVSKLAIFAFAMTFATSLLAGVLYVPNRSFESPGAPPDNPYATPLLDEWQKTPQPFWYDPTNFDNTPWEYLMGTFTNVTNPTNHIDNAHLNNLGFFFCIPETGFFQDYNSLSGTNATPSHAFNAKYNVGHSYKMTVAVVGMAPSMSNGVTMQANLYYRGVSNAIVVVASTTITNDPSVFSNHTHAVDFEVNVPTVTTNDAWAGQNIGIQFLSTATFTNIGGYWDLDNVRLIESIAIPNYSFESPGAPPDNPYATFLLDDWVKMPQPFWYDPTNFDNTPWIYLMGTFTNVTNPTNHIDNAHLNNLGFFFCIPETGLYQDLSATYRPGKAYNLTVAVVGMAPSMSNGVTMQANLFYRDASNSILPIASTTITNDPSVFSNHTHEVDFTTTIPNVKASDAWAGKNIGVQLLSTATFTNIGGYWDVDNVRLVETVATALTAPAKSSNNFNFTLVSEPELSFDILSSTNVTAPSTNWPVIGTVTNMTGSMPVTDTNAVATKRFYQARKL